MSCQDGSDGKITVSTNGGKPSTDITFTISPSAGSFVRTAANAGEFQGLPAGAYTISATDNCMDPISSGTITVSQPTRVTASVATSNPTCTNPYNGVLSVSNTSNGSGTYDYHLYKDGVEVRSSLGTSTTAWNLTDLPPGSYNLDIRDSSRPTCDGYTSNFVLAAVTPLGSTFTSNDVTCFLAGDGKISLTGSGGSGSYKFTALNTTTSQSFSNTTGSFSSLSPGNYTATIQNNNTCGDSYSNTNIIIKEPDDISFTLAAKKITCNGDDNGKITATVSGGNGSFNYQWEYSDGSGWKNYNLAGGTTAVIDNLFPADYRLKVSDLKNCSKTSSVVSIVDPKPLTISSALPVHVTCKGLTDGNIQVTAADGWGGYSYQYSANGTSYSSLLSTTKLAAGDYYVRVTDSGGCFFTYGDVITITEPSTALSATYSFSNYNGFNVKCFGGSDGQVTVTAIGGNGSPFPSGVYTYSFDGGAYGSTNSLVGIPTGSHTVHVKDERGCVYSENVLLSAPSALTPSLVDKNYIKCFGDNTGFIEVTATGGVPPNYEYKLGTGLFSSNARFSNLTAGSYQITVRDLNGCTATLNQSIASPNPAMTIGISKTNVSCFGLADGKITANVSGGAPTYTYEWTGRTETGNVIQSLAPGTYSIKVSDQEGCSQTTSATITQPLAPLTTSITPKPIQCFGETSGELQLFPTGGTLPYLYTIDNGLNYQVSNKFVGLAKGTYVAKIKDANSCAVSASADIVEPPLLSVSIPDKQNINCYGAATGSITVNATGGVAPYQYSLDGINYKSGSTFNGLPAGTYQCLVLK